MQEHEEWRGYRLLASEVVRVALRTPRAERLQFIRSRIGRLWLAWLRIDPDAVMRAIDRRAPPPV